jgi:hypothetical protein
LWWGACPATGDWRACPAPTSASFSKLSKEKRILTMPDNYV